MSELEESGDNTEFVRLTFTPDEYVALKEIAARRKKRFWNDYPLLISLFAFLLSLTTALISARIGYKKDIHDQLTELSTALRTLRDLNLKQIEIREKYAGGFNEGPASALLANDIYNTTMTAADIAFRVGTSATTASMIPLSNNLYSYGQHVRAIELAKLALDAAQTAPDEATALRWLGFMKLREGTAQAKLEGTEYFSQALNFEQKFGVLPVTEVAQFLKVGIQLDWADALAVMDCGDARKHFSEAWKILENAGRTPDLDQLRSNARQKLSGGIGGVAACLPVLADLTTK
jgi:hypothetical protein